jgi:hypothetical protein
MVRTKNVDTNAITKMVGGWGGPYYFNPSSAGDGNPPQYVATDGGDLYIIVTVNFKANGSWAGGTQSYGDFTLYVNSAYVTQVTLYANSDPNKGSATAVAPLVGYIASIGTGSVPYRLDYSCTGNGQFSVAWAVINGKR